jgi:hypothetical protein
VTQKITQKLCSQYYNWDGNVRVPSVCQLAKKMAFMAAADIYNVDANQVKVQNQLFFL